jgi:hypothetical protein
VPSRARAGARFGVGGIPGGRGHRRCAVGKPHGGHHGAPGEGALSAWRDYRQRGRRARDEDARRGMGGGVACAGGIPDGGDHDASGEGCLARGTTARGRDYRRRGRRARDEDARRGIGGGVACAGGEHHGASGEDARRGIAGGVACAGGGYHGGATRAGVIRGWGEDARRGQTRGRGHGLVVDALRAPLRISRDFGSD